MSNEDSETREGIKKRLLELSALANGIKDYELGASILTAYNLIQDQLDIEELRRLRDHSVFPPIHSDKDERLTQVFKGDNLVASFDRGSTSVAKDYRVVVNGRQTIPHPDNVTIQNGNLYVNGKLMIIDNATLANYIGLSLTGDTKSTSGNVSGPHLSVIELKDDGPYLNGKRIEGVIDMNIDSKVGDHTKVVIKLAANVHGIDDIDKGYSI